MASSGQGSNLREVHRVRMLAAHVSPVVDSLRTEVQIYPPLSVV